MTRWISPLALIGLALATAAPADASKTCLEGCNSKGILKIEQIGKDGIHTDHRYLFRAICALTVDARSTAAPQGLRIEAHYSPLSQLGTEKVLGNDGATLLFERSFRCNGDPYRTSASCTETGRIDHGIQTVGQSWNACHSAVSPLILEGPQAEVNARVAKEMADLPAPIILSPSEGEEIPHFDLQEIEVKHPPREGWFANATFPATVNLVWVYKGPDGQSTGVPKNVIPEMTGVGASPQSRVFHAEQMKEGLWTVEASFPGGPQKYLSRVSFWIGDRVDPKLPAPSILMPMEGTANPADPVQAYVVFEDEEFVSRLRRGQMLNRDPKPLEMEFMFWDLEKMTWKWTDGSIVFNEIPLGKKFDLWTTGEGKFRFRVRLKRKDGGGGYPWSGWRTYYVGELGEEIRTTQRSRFLKAGLDRGETGPGPGPGGQVGSKALGQGAHVTSSLHRFPGLLSPVAGQQFSGDVMVKMQSNNGGQPVALRIEVYESGRWRRLKGPQLPQPAPPGRTVRLRRGLFGDAQRARVRVVMPDGSTGPPTEFGFSRLRQFPRTGVPKPPDAKTIKPGAVRPPDPPRPNDAKTKLKGIPR